MPRSHSRKLKILKRQARKRLFSEKRRKTDREVSDTEVLASIEGRVKSRADARMPTRKRKWLSSYGRTVVVRPGTDVSSALKKLKKPERRRPR